MQTAAAVSPRIRVAFRGDQLAVYAAMRFQAGEEILTVFGRTVDRPSRYSVQVGVDEHVEPDDETGVSPAETRFPWRFLNHSCEPTAVLRGRRFVARRALEPGDEVTFDYETSEWRMAEPFACGCGHAACRGRIAGYAALDTAQRVRIAAAVAPHLVAAALRSGR